RRVLFRSHREKKYIKFGVSPFGIWDNKKDHPDGSASSGLSGYRQLYADALKWLEEGWVDYINPQIYFPFGHAVAPYEVLADWWGKHTHDVIFTSDMRLIGLMRTAPAGVTAAKSPIKCATRGNMLVHKEVFFIVQNTSRIMWLAFATRFNITCTDISRYRLPCPG